MLIIFVNFHIHHCVHYRPQRYRVIKQMMKYIWLHLYICPRCKYGGQCTSEDPTHMNKYDHPDYCEQGSHCKNVTPEHQFARRHLTHLSRWT